MNTYIITFYSHFGASRLKSEMRKAGIDVQLKPVPRFLSSSCGTCAILETENLTFPQNMDEVEQIVMLKPGFSAKNAVFEILYSSLD